MEAHVHAYNKRDLDRFLACFSPDCVIEDARGNVVARGHTDLRARFGPIFEENPELHCDVLHRARVGEYVVDEEHISGRYGGEQRLRHRDTRVDADIASLVTTISAWFAQCSRFGPSLHPPERRVFAPRVAPPQPRRARSTRPWRVHRGLRATCRSERSLLP